MKLSARLSFCYSRGSLVPIFRPHKSLLQVVVRLNSCLLWSRKWLVGVCKSNDKCPKGPFTFELLLLLLHSCCFWTQVPEDELWETSIETSMGLVSENVWLVHGKTLHLVRDKLNIRIDDFGFEPFCPDIYLQSMCNIYHHRMSFYLNEEIST